MRHVRRVWMGAVVALSSGLAVVVIGEGFSTDGAVKLVEEIAVVLLAAIVFAAAVAILAVRLAGWRNPESESDFERLVLRSELLAREGLAADPDENDFLELDPLDDQDFAELVREALDELPDLLRNTLRHTPVVISDKGRRRGAYGLYEGGGATREDTHSRIIIFRDTLRRDFGHDPELLRAEVTRTVRHELAHHVGFDELGVSRLDL